QGRPGSGRPSRQRASSGADGLGGARAVLFPSRAAPLPNTSCRIDMHSWETAGQSESSLPPGPAGPFLPGAAMTAPENSSATAPIGGLGVIETAGIEIIAESERTA